MRPHLPAKKVREYFQLTPKRRGAFRDAAPSDMQYLTDENVAEIGDAL